MKTIKMTAWLCVSTLFFGCGIGYNSTLFFTKTNVGVDIDQTPPTAEISIKRREGVITPSFEQGKMLPVMASFRFDQRCLLWQLSSMLIGLPRIDLATTFSTGDAAATMSYLYDKPDADEKEESELRLDKKPKTSWQYLECGKVKPVIFGTDTCTGLKVVFSGQGEAVGLPPSFKFGFNRKEFAYVPISCYPVTSSETDYDKPHFVKQPSLLTTLDTNINLTREQNNREEGASSQIKNKSKLSMGYIQYFATGVAADNLAKKQNVRRALFQRMDPNLAQDPARVLCLKGEDWYLASLSWMNEPSGLSPSGLKGEGGPYAVCVDDEEPGIFVLQKLLPEQDKSEEDRLVVRRILHFPKQNKEKDYDLNDTKDLEAIAYDPYEKIYYAATSHRGTGEESCRFISFKINEEEWDDPYYSISKVDIEGALDIRDKIKDAWNNNNNYKDEHGEKIQLEKDDIKKTEKHLFPYQFEIEGMAYRTKNKCLYLGLKVPRVIDKKSAILIQYDPKEKKFEKIHPIPLQGYGISGLAYDEPNDRLLIAGNPPQKPREGDKYDTDKETYLGKSIIFIGQFVEDGSVKIINKSTHIKINKSFHNPEKKRKAKLEGIAPIGSELWFCFDGPEPDIRRFDQKEILSQLENVPDELLFKELNVTGDKPSSGILALEEPSGILMLGKKYIITGHETKNPFWVKDNGNEWEIPFQNKKKLDDIEALAPLNERTFFAVCSQSKTKKKGEVKGEIKAERNKIAKITLKGNFKNIEEIKVYGDFRSKIIEFLNKEKSNEIDIGTLESSKPKDGGLNIEGAAYWKNKNQLLLGLKNPVSKEQKAIVITLKNPVGLFNDKQEPEFGEVFFIEGTNKEGIRAMTEIEDEFLLLLEKNKEYRVVKWNPANNQLKKIPIEDLHKLGKLSAICWDKKEENIIMVKRKKNAEIKDAIAKIKFPND